MATPSNGDGRASDQKRSESDSRSERERDDETVRPGVAVARAKHGGKGDRVQHDDEH